MVSHKKKVVKKTVVKAKKGSGFFKSYTKVDKETPADKKRKEKRMKAMKKAEKKLQKDLEKTRKQLKKVQK